MTETMTRDILADKPRGVPLKAEREPGEPLSREDLASMASDVLKKLHARATASTFRSKKTDPELLATVRAFTSGVVALNGVLRDQEIADLEQRVRDLEERKK